MTKKKKKFTKTLREHFCQCLKYTKELVVETSRHWFAEFFKVLVELILMKLIDVGYMDERGSGY